MLIRLISLFVLVPILDLLLLIELGKRIGSIPAVLLVIVTGFCGAILARLQGFNVLLQIVERLRRGELPGDQLADGVLILCGALFLLSPGLLTDAAGFLLLLSPPRRVIKRYLLKRLRRALEEGTFRVYRP